MRDSFLERKTQRFRGIPEVTGLTADGNGNNQIDPGDYDVWRSHIGPSAGSESGASANATVSEPATMATLLLGMLVMCVRRRMAGHQLINA